MSAGRSIKVYVNIDAGASSEMIAMNIPHHGHSFLNHGGLWSPGPPLTGLGKAVSATEPGVSSSVELECLKIRQSLPDIRMARSIGRVYPPRYRQGC